MKTIIDFLNFMQGSYVYAEPVNESLKYEVTLLIDHIGVGLTLRAKDWSYYIVRRHSWMAYNLDLISMRKVLNDDDMYTVDTDWDSLPAKVKRRFLKSVMTSGRK